MGIFTPQWLKDIKQGKPIVVISQCLNEKAAGQIIQIAAQNKYELQNMSQSRDPNPISGMFLTNYTMVFKKK